MWTNKMIYNIIIKGYVSVVTGSSSEPHPSTSSGLSNSMPVAARPTKSPQGSPAKDEMPSQEEVRQKRLAFLSRLEQKPLSEDTQSSFSEDTPSSSKESLNNDTMPCPSKCHSGYTVVSVISQVTYSSVTHHSGHTFSTQATPPVSRSPNSTSWMSLTTQATFSTQATPPVPLSPNATSWMSLTTQATPSVHRPHPQCHSVRVPHPDVTHHSGHTFSTQDTPLVQNYLHYHVRFVVLK